MFALVLIQTLPPLYRSEATILVERQEVPEDIVPSLVSDYIDHRFQVLTQQVLVTSHLVRIAERFDLYPEERGSMSRTGLADRMRSRANTEILRTDGGDPGSGSGETTLAFRVSFADNDPRKARQITDELVSAYLSGNLETRRSVAEQTEAFFASEGSEIDRRIREIEDRLTEFTTKNRELLPEEAAFKRELLSNAQAELRALDSELRSLREQESFLQTQLALTDEFEPVDRAAGAVTPESQLEVARAELATAQARYSSGHPDLVRLRQEVSSLERTVGRRGRNGALVEQESALSAELARLQDRYTAAHPDVQRVQRELIAVREALAQRSSASRRGGADQQRNPTYVQLSAQLNSIKADIRSGRAQIEELQEERAALQEQLARAPAVEREYTRLTRELENAVADREALATKQTTAQLSGSLETTDVGERLTIIEPPFTPTAPVSPNKKLILALGVVLAAGSGGFSVIVAELLDRSIRSTSDLKHLLGDAPLAALPTFMSPRDRRWRWIRRGGFTALIGVIAAAGTVTYVHYRIVPLDVLGYPFLAQLEGRGSDAQANPETTSP